MLWELFEPLGSCSFSALCWTFLWRSSLKSSSGHTLDHRWRRLVRLERRSLYLAVNTPAVGGRGGMGTVQERMSGVGGKGARSLFDPPSHPRAAHPLQRSSREDEGMSRFARKERPPPGFEVLEPTLNALENELRESERAFRNLPSPFLSPASPRPNSIVAGRCTSADLHRVEAVPERSIFKLCTVEPRIL